jgi:hypothetical protein
MLKRLPPINFANRRDVLLFTVAALVVFGITVVWGVVLAEIAPFNSQNISKYFLVLLFFASAALVAFIPRLLRWNRQEDHPRARLLVRFGLALELFAVLASLVGLAYATDPSRSVPVGFATFTAMLIGVFAAGFGANALAPAKA